MSFSLELKDRRALVNIDRNLSLDPENNAAKPSKKLAHLPKPRRSTALKGVGQMSIEKRDVMFQEGTVKLAAVARKRNRKVGTSRHLWLSCMHIEWRVEAGQAARSARMWATSPGWFLNLTVPPQTDLQRLTNACLPA